MMNDLVYNGGTLIGMSLPTNLAVFLTLFKTPLTPPLPLVDFFLTDWTLCTALRLDNVRHRSEETMSNIS